MTLPAPPFLQVLGIAQDAGVPQAGCRRACCRAAWRDPGRRRSAACLGLVAPATGRRWLFDATPDFREQWARFDRRSGARPGGGPDGIFLTHGHIGHYVGLMHLGREAMGARQVPVYAMPRMSEFLRGHAPWQQLVRLKNIDLRPLRAGRPVRLGAGLAVMPVPVPHRAEYTETVAFRIAGPHRAALWLPDIDRWEDWNIPLEQAIAGVDVAWLDGTFFAAGELSGRDPAEVPHPLVRHTLARLGDLPAPERRKVRFVHLNHSNPALRPGGAAAREIGRAGMRLAREGERFTL